MALKTWKQSLWLSGKLEEQIDIVSDIHTLQQCYVTQLS